MPLFAVAGRLKEEFNKPVAVIAIDEKYGKASCRSIKGIDFGSKILEAKLAGLLVAGGGHAMAAGFSVEKEKISELQQYLNKVIKPELDRLVEKDVCYYDAKIASTAATVKTIKEVAQLEPFGPGNPEPVFMIEDMYVLKAQIVGQKHISVTLTPDRNGVGKWSVRAIAFSAVGTEIEAILMSKKAKVFSVVGQLKINLWQDREYPQFIIKDILA